MPDLYIRVSKTGYVKGWGSKWVAGLSPLERSMVHDGQMVLVVNGVSRLGGLPAYRVVKFYGRYGYCPRVVAPAYTALAARAVRESQKWNSTHLSGNLGGGSRSWFRPQCTKNNDLPF